jgi:hypothetical protein
LVLTSAHVSGLVGRAGACKRGGRAVSHRCQLQGLRAQPARPGLGSVTIR